MSITRKVRPSGTENIDKIYAESSRNQNHFNAIASDARNIVLHASRQENGIMLQHDDVIYKIVTDRFADGDPSNNTNVNPTDPMKRHGGDWLGIVQKFPYLRDLGVTTLWISPVYLNPAHSYHGYHPLDFESVDPHWCSPTFGPVGSPKCFQHFVEIAHEHNFKVMIDAIVSHTGEEHLWCTNKPEWINWNQTGVEKEWFKSLPNLDHDNINVNVYFVRNVLWWIAQSDVDAVRIDAARHVESCFWKYFKLYAMGEFTGVTVAGEFWDGDPKQVAVYQNLHGFDAMFDFPLYHALRDVFISDHPFTRLARPCLHDAEAPGILDLDHIYRNAMQLITFIGNHDTSRFFTEAGGDADHDRALQRMKLAQAFVFCMRGVPQVYYGDELAMPGGWDPDNRRDMPWHWIADKEQRNAPESQRARSLLEFTRRLIEIRRTHRAITLGLPVTLYVQPHLLVMLKSLVDEAVLIAFNNADTPSNIAVPLAANSRIPDIVRDRLHDGLRFEPLLGVKRAIELKDGHVVLDLAGRSVAIFRADPAAFQHDGSLIEILNRRPLRRKTHHA